RRRAKPARGGLFPGRSTADMGAMDDFELSRLVYLTILGAAVMSGVFAAYRGRLSTGLRDALTWGLIFVALMIGFGMKDDLIRALNPAAPIALSDGSLELRRETDGHFHIDAEVNGAAVRFLVDTGATSTVLTRDDARRVGLDPARLAFTGRASTANGVVATAPVRLARLEIAGQELREVRANVNGGDLFQSLLGMDLISRFSRVTLEGDRLILTP
ncbi:MAG: TIGR02281 family clan AA aspartic protease, partial [Pseudomonadota bacterium]